MPPLQTSQGLHTVLHPPQLSESVFGSEQLPLQQTSFEAMQPQPVDPLVLPPVVLVPEPFDDPFPGPPLVAPLPAPLLEAVPLAAVLLPLVPLLAAVVVALVPEDRVRFDLFSRT